MTQRAGFAAIIGAPNAGKSTLTNRLVGAKVSIVTQKVQTTRFPVRGVAMQGEAQIVLVDTPGIFQPRRKLDTHRAETAFGFHSQTTFEAGLRRTIEWYRAQQPAAAGAL